MLPHSPLARAAVIATIALVSYYALAHLRSPLRRAQGLSWPLSPTYGGFAACAPAAPIWPRSSCTGGSGVLSAWDQT
jgi:hypothetical protein